MRNPRTRREWQEAVDAAGALLLLDSARKYGLITGGPSIDFERCVWIVEQARRRGITPDADAGVRFILAWNEEQRRA